MPYKGQRKRIDPTQEHGFIGVKPSKKSTPVPWVERPSITEYKYKRNNIWLNDMFTPDEFKEQIRLIYPI